jgi:chromosome segregation ATPase
MYFFRIIFIYPFFKFILMEIETKAAIACFVAGTIATIGVLDSVNYRLKNHDQTKKIIELKSDGETLDNKIASLEFKLNLSQNTTTKLKKDLKDYDVLLKGVGILSKSLRDNSKDLDYTSTALNHVFEEMGDLQNRFTEKNSQYIELQQDYNKLQKDYLGFGKQNKCLQRELDILKKRNKGLIKSHKELSKQNMENQIGKYNQGFGCGVKNFLRRK